MSGYCPATTGGLSLLLVFLGMMSGCAMSSPDTPPLPIPPLAHATPTQETSINAIANFEAGVTIGDLTFPFPPKSHVVTDEIAMIQETVGPMSVEDMVRTVRFTSTLPLTEVLAFYDATMPQAGFTELCIVRATPFTAAISRTAPHPCFLPFGKRARDFLAHRLYALDHRDLLYAALLIDTHQILELHFVNPMRVSISTIQVHTIAELCSYDLLQFCHANHRHPGLL